MLTLALSAWAIFVLVRRLTGSAAAAFVAGLAYTFNSLTLHELPRNPVVVVEAEDGRRRRVEIADGPAEQRAVLDALLDRPLEADWALRFPPVRERGLRIQVGWREEDPSWPAWSVSGCSSMAPVIERRRRPSMDRLLLKGALRTNLTEATP